MNQKMKPGTVETIGYPGLDEWRRAMDQDTKSGAIGYASLDEWGQAMTKTRPIVKLIGKDGNAFAILGTVRQALKRAGYTEAEVKQYTDDATSGDYDHLLQVTMQWVEVK